MGGTEIIVSGRFVGHQNLDALKAFFAIDKAECEVTPNLNVAPSHEILAIIRRNGQNRLEKFHWGLVPSWARDVSIGIRMINARLESIAEKPSFRNAFKKRRCMIPADGFFEWKTETGIKQPMFITLPDRKPFAFAGLWETWQSKDGEDSIYKSCTIITTRAGESFSAIHHRMPVILKPQVYELWLDPENQNAVELTELLNNETISELVSAPVSKHISSTNHLDQPRIGPVSKPQQTVFDWPEHREPDPK